MWGLGLFAYVVAVMQRTSFGVASVQATDRFSAGASLVSLSVVVQLLTYSAMQVPVGVLADRFGSRTVIGCGAVLMFLGQLDLALSTNVVSAIVARVLVGAGDAMTFAAVLRLIPAWFSPGRIAVLNQLTAMAGQAGQVLSSFPLAAILATAGWQPAFVSAASLSGIAAVLIFAVLRNAPPGRSAHRSPADVSALQHVRNVVRIPASLLGFWIHWMCSSWIVTFAMMWGYPFMTKGLGYPQPVAAAMFTLMVIAGIPFGPILGILSRRAPLQRTNLALFVSAMVAVPWVAILLWPGAAPVWLLAVLMIGMAACGPGGSLGFDVARASNPLQQIGAATGFVIVGGFFGGMLSVLSIGITLDALGGYTPDAFRWAMATQFIFWGIGVVGAYVTRRRARRLDRARGVRYRTLGATVRRELSNWLVQWRIFSNPDQLPPADEALELVVEDGRTVRIPAVLPGINGELTAIDTAANEAAPEWWRSRVDEYLCLVATPELEIGSIEIRCRDSADVLAVRAEILSALAEREAGLSFEVTPWARTRPSGV
ncbi:hypothetical protein PROP_00577 [Propionicimonas sp. T2.31MG-18]